MSADETPDPHIELLADDDVEIWTGAGSSGEHQSLVDLVNRVLDKGVCITGDVTISVAGVDLVYLGLNAILTSVASARERIDPTVGPRREQRAVGDGG